MVDDSSPQKRCSQCGETKHLEMFNRFKHHKDGRKSECKACAAKASKKYRIDNAEALRERGKVWHRENAEAINKRHRAHYAAHPEYRENYRLANWEKIKERHRKYYLANRERFRDYGQAYYAAHAEEILEQKRAYHKANAEAIREKSRIWREKNPERFKAQLRAWRDSNSEAICLFAQKRRARIKGNGGVFTVAEKRMIEAEQGGLCAYCKRLIKLTIDHIIPLKQGGRHEASNICLACPRCNSSKNNRTPEQWVNRWYLRED